MQIHYKDKEDYKQTNFMGNDNITLADMLLKNDAAHLLQYAELSDIEVNEKDEKSRLVKLIADDISCFPNKLLQILPKEDVYKLHSMVHAPNHKIILNDTFYEGDCISRIGLTNSRYEDKKNIEYISSDLAEYLTKSIDYFIENINNNSSKYQDEQLLLGLLNLYGLLSHKELLSCFKQYRKQTTEEGFSQIIHCSYLIYSTSTRRDKELTYVSPFMIDPIFWKAKIEEHKKISIAEFTEEEVMMAGNTEFPIPPKHQNLDLLQDLLKEINKSDEEIKEYISSIWTGINMDENYLELLFMQYDKSSVFPFKGTIENDLKFTDRLTAAIAEAAKTLPRWEYKGHSIADIS